MIDFRYHLVSLVSVFLALAVGIVLGAGPLKESIGDTLTEQVNSLRSDRDALRQDLDRSNTALGHRDEFITAVSPELIANQLGGRTVVLVGLPGSLTDGLDQLRTALEDSGATVTGQVRLREDWNDPAKEADRETLIERLASLVGLADAGNGPTLDSLLARALVTGELADSGVPSPVGKALLDAMEEVGLLEIEEEPTGRATEAILLAPAVDTTTTTASPSTSAEPADDVEGWASVALALDTGSDGAVVYGPASAAGDGGLIAQIRADTSVGGNVSTVDTGGTSMGPPTAILALSEQLRGAAGAYGFGPGAKAPLPDVSEEPS